MEVGVLFLSNEVISRSVSSMMACSVECFFAKSVLAIEVEVVDCEM